MHITNLQIGAFNKKMAQNVYPSLINGKYEDKLTFIILETFFYGRILFSVGYLFGILVNLESFRAYGVGLTFASVVVAISYSFDIHIWTYF